MIAYKLMNLRMNGTLAPLFINRKQVLRIGETHTAELHPTKGYKERKGWHCLEKMSAPHLLVKSPRVWVQVLISDYEALLRPESQGGMWYLANKMTLLKFMGEACVD